MRVPQALDAWAAAHASNLSPQTLAELRRLRDGLSSSMSFADVDIRSLPEPMTDLNPQLRLLFDDQQAEHAVLLLDVVRTWLRDSAAPATPPDPVLPEPALPESPTLGASAAIPGAVPHGRLEPADLGTRLPSELGDSPAFLSSDRVEDEDRARLLGPERRGGTALAAVLLALAVAGILSVAGWLLLSGDDDVATAPEPGPDQVAAEPATAVPAAPTEDAPSDAVATTDTPASAEPTAAPTPVVPRYWADTTTILNSGSAEIAASTYTVSPANRAVLTGHTAAITGIAVTTDGRVLTSGADLRLVDWGADVTLASPDVTNVAAPLTSLIRVGPDIVLAGDADGSLTAINLADGSAAPQVLPVHRSSISALIELADGRVAAASVDGDVRVLDLATPDEGLSLGHPVEVTDIAQLDNGLLATVAVDGLVRLWNLQGDTPVPDTVRATESPLTAIAALADGRIAIADVDGTITIASREANSVPDLVLTDHRGPVRALFVLDDNRLASGGDDSTVRVWDVTTGEAEQVLEGHGDLVRAIERLPDGRLVTAGADGTGRVWDLSIPGPAPIEAPHDWNISAMEHWSNDQFVTGGDDGLVVLASTSETVAPVEVTRHEAPIVGLAVTSRDRVVSLDASSNLKITTIGENSRSELDATIAAGATALGARAETIATGHADGSVRWWAGDEELGSVAAHGSGVNDVAVLASGLIASAGEDRTVRIIDPTAPERVRVFDRHTAPVTVVAELADGRIASAGTDGIRVWSPDDIGGEVIELTGHRSNVVSILGLPENLLMSTAEDGRVRLWDLSRPEGDAVTLVDVPGVVNPHLIRAGSGLYVAGAGRGYVVFTID